MKEERYPWKRLNGETHLSYKFFTDYLKMGPERSIDKVRKKNKKKASYKRQLETWSSQYSWVERAQMYDDHIANRKLEITEKQLQELYEISLENAKEVLERLILIAKGKRYAKHEEIRAIKVFLDKIGF